MAKSTSPHTENPFDELSMFIESSKNKIFDIIKNRFPIKEIELDDILITLERNDVNMNIKQLEMELDRLVDDKKLIKGENMWGYFYDIVDK